MSWPTLEWRLAVKPKSLALPVLLDQLERLYGAPSRPLPRRALEWILWENAAYLVPDERRAQAWRALRKRTRLRAEGILALPRRELQQIAALGGMQPDRRVTKWITIAELVQDSFDGDLEPVLGQPVAKARRALQRLPGIGRPGADKILLFTGTHAVPALESNGLRVLTRLGHVREATSYDRTYRDAVAVLEPHAGRGCPWLIRAHQLLRTHGQELCKNNIPRCDECPLEAGCPSSS
jgi:endonuclease III